jgi:hypothetical protein
MLTPRHWGPPEYHPFDNATDWREYQQLKEIGYTKKKMQQGLLFTRTRRRMYVVRSLRGVVLPNCVLPHVSGRVLSADRPLVGCAGRIRNYIVEER